ncbi:hypothetical protein EDC04DRAFT_2606313 [Pisolithus marmoratus]|nr:hypothetical protein EDC04DRAFT_2606313 [Pisolithus marmoratus]
MSDYYWPMSMPTVMLMDYITQIRYVIQEDDNPDAIQIYTMYINRNKMKSGHRTFLPATYLHYMNSLLWKYYLYIDLAMHFNPHRTQKKYKKFWPTLLKYIALLDNVVESVLHPCLKIKNEDIGDQVCQSLEEYCITEFLIGRHDPESVNFF